MTDRDASSQELSGRMGKRFGDDATEQVQPDAAATAYDALRGGVRATRERKQVFPEPDQATAIEREYKRLAYEYGVEFDNRDLELNAHFYPVLLEYGLSDVEDMDASDFDAALEQYHESYASE